MWGAQRRPRRAARVRHPDKGCRQEKRLRLGTLDGWLLVGVYRFLALVLAFGDMLFDNLIQLSADEHDKRRVVSVEHKDRDAC